MDDKPRWASVGLDDVFEFRAGVFQAGRWMLDDGFAEDFVELGSFDFEMTSGVNFGCEFEKFGDVLSGFATSNKNWRVRQEVKIVLEFIENVVEGAFRWSFVGVTFIFNVFFEYGFVLH